MFGGITKFIFFSLLFWSVFIIIWIKFVPGREIAPVFKNTPLEKIACSYPVRIAGQSMAPAFAEGQVAVFNKCLSDRTNLDLNTIILFKNPDNIMRIGIIREISQEENNFFYAVSPRARPIDIINVYPDDIIAIWQEN